MAGDAFPLPLVPLYGLDIETDTSCGGLDPRVGGVVAAAVCSVDRCWVLSDRAEPDLLASLDRLLSELPAGVVVTWHGAGFDLPFLADRAAACGVPLGLELSLDPALDVRRPLAGHPGAYRARWGAHTHLDAYQLWRDAGHALSMSCSLKAMAEFFGLAAVEVDRARIHELDPSSLAAYVASDAALARRLAELRWHRADRHIDAASPLLSASAAARP